MTQKERCKLYYEKNKAALKEKSKKYYEDNRDEVKERVKKHKENSPMSLVEAQRKWYLKNRDKKIKAALEYAKSNPQKHRDSGNKRRFLERETNDKTINKKSLSILLLEQGGKCNICASDISKSYHKDHIIPLSLNGEHSISNIQLLCPECNRRKSDKTNEHFLIIKNKQV